MGKVWSFSARLCLAPAILAFIVVGATAAVARPGKAPEVFGGERKAIAVRVVVHGQRVARIEVTAVARCSDGMTRHDDFENPRGTGLYIDRHGRFGYRNASPQGFGSVSGRVMTQRAVGSFRGWFEVHGSSGMPTVRCGTASPRGESVRFIAKRLPQA